MPLFFFCFNHVWQCNQHFLATATTGLKKELLCLKEIIDKDNMPANSVLSVDFIQLKYLMPSQLKKRALGLLLWFSTSTSTFPAQRLLWCCYKKKSCCHQGYQPSGCCSAGTDRHQHISGAVTYLPFHCVICTSPDDPPMILPRIWHAYLLSPGLVVAQTFGNRNAWHYPPSLLLLPGPAPPGLSSPFPCSMAKLTSVFLPAGVKRPSCNTASTSRHLWVSRSCRDMKQVSTFFYYYYYSQWEQYALMHLSKTGGKTKYPVGVHQNYRQEQMTRVTPEIPCTQKRTADKPNMNLEGQHGLRNQIWVRLQVLVQCCSTQSMCSVAWDVRMSFKKEKMQQFYALYPLSILMGGLKHSIREITGDSSLGEESTRTAQTRSFRLTLGVTTWHFHTGLQTESSPLNIVQSGIYWVQTCPERAEYIQITALFQTACVQLPTALSGPSAKAHYEMGDRRRRAPRQSAGGQLNNNKYLQPFTRCSDCKTRRLARHSSSQPRNSAYLAAGRASF